MSKRQYIIVSQAWYATPCLDNARFVDEILIMVNKTENPDDGFVGEFAIRWYNLGGGIVAPKLEVFDDAWMALGTCRDLLTEFAMSGMNKTNHSLREIVDVLEKCGFVDVTPRELPDHLLAKP